MFGKVKRFFGIEGVKIELITADEIGYGQKVINGKIKFYSLTEQKVSQIKVSMFERYYRGRSKRKLVDDYKMGEIIEKLDLMIPANETLEAEFELPLTWVKSGMDDLAEKNFIFGGLVKVAKFVKGAKSIYRLEAEALAMGTALSPFAKKELELKK